MVEKDEKPNRLSKPADRPVVPDLEAPPQTAAVQAAPCPPTPVTIVLATRDRDIIGKVEWPGPPPGFLAYGGHGYSHVGEHEGLWLFAAIN